MACAADTRFPKNLRIRKRSQYLRVQGEGSKVHSRGFLGLVIVKAGGGVSRLGVTVTKKYGNAVARNRVRRLVREAFRTGRMGLPAGVELVVVAKRSARDLGSQATFEDLSALGRKVRKITEATK